MRITEHDLTGDEIAQFLAEHAREMRAVTPLESKHALDLEGLRQDGVTFWVVYSDEDRIVAAGALKRLDQDHAEIKSMRTVPEVKRSGIASMLLTHIVAHARAAGLSRLSLETGSTAFFEPARRLYEKHGFVPCGPFANYVEDPNSAYYTFGLEHAS